MTSGAATNIRKLVMDLSTVSAIPSKGKDSATPLELAFLVTGKQPKHLIWRQRRRRKRKKKEKKHTHTHTHTHSLSLSLSHTHTYTHK